MNEKQVLCLIHEKCTKQYFWANVCIIQVYFIKNLFFHPNRGYTWHQ